MLARRYHTQTHYPQRFLDAQIASRAIRDWLGRPVLAACQPIVNRPPRDFRV